MLSIFKATYNRLQRWKRSRENCKNYDLIIYNTYHIHAKNLTNVGMDSPWMHQQKILWKEYGDTVDPCVQNIGELNAPMREEI